MARLDLIENPKNPKVKLAYWLVKKQYGKVITPMKVIYARKPALMDMIQKVYGNDKKLDLPDDLKEMIRHFVAVLNGCGFCKDISKARAQKNAGSNDKIASVLNYWDSDAFSEKEKAALAWVESMVQHKEVSDELFREGKKHFSEEQLIDITYLAASETYVNMMNKAFGIEADGFCALWGGN